MSQIVKKQVTVLATSLLMIIASMEAVQGPNLSLTKQAIDLYGFSSKKNSTNSVFNLEYVLYIYYPVHFRKDQNNIKTLINLSSKVNAMHLTYAKKIGLFV